MFYLRLMPAPIGVKTGFTAGAGNVLVAAAARKGRRLIAVAMGSVDAAVDAAALLDLGFARLARTILLRAGTPVGALVFDPAGTVVVRAGASVRGIQDPASVDVSFHPNERVSSPLGPGSVVGRIVVSVGGTTIARVRAVTAAPVATTEPSFAARALATVLGWIGGVVTE